MSEWIIPDKIHLVPIEGGELALSPAYDVIHRWRRVGFNVLRYWDMDNGKMCNVALDDAGTDYLVQEVGLFTIPRDKIYDHEHKMYIDWKTETMTDSDFGLGL